MSLIAFLGLLWRAGIFSREVYNSGQWYKMRVVTNAGGSAAQENGFLDSSWVTAVMGTVNAMLCSVLGDIFNIAGLCIIMVIK